MNRRAFACGLAVMASCLGSLGVPGPAHAQQPASPRRIGVLLVGTPPESRQVRGLTQGLKMEGPPFTYAQITLSHVSKARLPAIHATSWFAEGGGLMSYGANQMDMWRRSAWYVDKILKGAKPGDLPIEQPSKFELVVNLKTAKTLGLKIPDSLLVQATEVIK